MNFQKLKRLNLRQPKYIFPRVIFLPLLGLIYFGMETFKGNGKAAGNVVTDSINMSLTEARSEGMDDKMTAMNKHFAEGGAFTAVDGIGDDYEQKDTTGSGYNDKERQDINAVNAERLRQMKAEQDLRERQQANMNRINGYGSSGYGGSGYGNRSYGGGRTQQDDLNDYARELERIQNRSMDRQRQYQAEQEQRDREEEAEERRQQQAMINALTGNTKKKGKKEEKTDEEIEKEASERLKENYKSEAQWRLSKDIRDFYVNKAGVELPEAFLKRWLLHANDGKVTAEQVEEEFPAFAEDFKWQLVRGSLMKKFELQVSADDLKDAAKAFVTYQYAMYGIGNVPQEMIDEAVHNVLHDQKQVERLAEQVEDQKVLDKIKSVITLKAKKISAEKFKELK